MNLQLGDRLRDTVLIKINYPKCRQFKTATCSSCPNLQQCYRAVAKMRWQTAGREIMNFLTERTRRS